MTKIIKTEEGDTWFRVSRRHGVNEYALYAANPGLPAGDFIIPGTSISVPDTSGAGADAKASGALIVDTLRPYGYVELKSDAELLGDRYPMMDWSTIGRSVLGRELFAVRIGTGPKEVFYNGSFHANEWITSLVLMKFIEDASRAAGEGVSMRNILLSALFERVTLWIVPMVNPDGVELVHTGAYPGHPYRDSLLHWNDGYGRFEHWKANIRGVDLNDQFPAHWEEERERRSPDGPGPRDFAGEHPLSEPEALAVARFTEQRDFKLTMAFHSQGREIYWNYRDMEPPQSERIASDLSAASGYAPVKLTGSDAGYKDWWIQERRRPGFTVELGLGVNPLPLGQFSLIYREAFGILLGGLVAAADGNW
ncbi:M14 family zinc carboxypeptidase [Paenibacillus alkalitolerans]|uniref:M14 family zinc carboxypeptidase n=1 Tax=Paenibacillus alkalitolerans TaxID=2799335 RepID=UPI0018F35477|nr:M14 family metallopeptidase [Paenibacillus alkalitolerans]